MVLKTMQYLSITVGVELVQINITFPTSNDAVLQLVQNALESNPGIFFCSVNSLAVVTLSISISLPLSLLVVLVQKFIVFLSEISIDVLPGITFATFDHISSSPAVMLPLKRIIALCRQHNVSTLIDGIFSRCLHSY